MKARVVGLERDMFRCSAALFAAAVGFAAYSAVEEPRARFGGAIVAIIAAYFGCMFVLKRVGDSGSRRKVPMFDLRDIEAIELDELLLCETLGGELLLTAADRVTDELVLTKADRLETNSEGSELLELNDMIAAAGADSRVVRLFDRSAMPTSGQPSSTRHVGRSPAASPPSDAAQALSDALAELRRSLR